MGLAGLFIVRDKEEQNLNLPSNEHELNYVIQDRFINEEGRLEYRPSMMGAFGNRIFINGLSKNKFKVRRGLNRIRLLNGCNARIFNFELDKGKDVWQIGSDGGLLKKPHRLKKFFFAPAERIDFLFDFTDYSIGEIVKLESLPLVDGRGKKYTVIEFEVTEESDELYSIPTFLSNLPDINPREAANLNSPKRFELVPKRGVGWTINGHGYEENRYENEELIKFGTTEAWEFYNPTGIPHPMHIHGTQFQVIKRYPSEFEGCLDKGWKDTILVMPGDRVKVIKRFNTFKGDFLYHCHNLEHEDMSMMRNFRIY
jgi:FtsP/CotA-like multicopper oxidase with cupredoxin domain